MTHVTWGLSGSSRDRAGPQLRKTWTRIGASIQTAFMTPCTTGDTEGRCGDYQQASSETLLNALHVEMGRACCRGARSWRGHPCRGCTREWVCVAKGCPLEKITTTEPTQAKGPCFLVIKPTHSNLPQQGSLGCRQGAWA